MRKYTLKRLLPWVITIGVIAVIAIVGFFLFPYLDFWINGGNVNRLVDFTPLYEGILGTFKNLFSFSPSMSKRVIVALIGLALALAILIAWFIVILCKKHYKKLIYWGIYLVCVAVFVTVASLMFAGTKSDYFVADGNWIVSIGFDDKFVNLAERAQIHVFGADSKCLVGSIVGLIIGGLSALGLVLMGISFIVDLVPARNKDVSEEEVAAALQERLDSGEISEDEVPPALLNKLNSDQIRKIVHDECEILYLRLIRNKAFAEKKEEEVVKEEHIARNANASDDAYYERMISELGMFRKDEPKAEPVPQPAQLFKKVVPAVKPAAKPVAKPVPAAAGKIIRIPFEKRIVEADKVMKEHFNELKSEILSYGVKSRVSNSGDTFRLHTVTYVKVTIAGKSLKLYLALNPKDYKDSTLPIADASKKAIYKEIPLVFKVKSELSLRRAKQLIADAMAKGGLKQGDVVAHDWVKEIKNGNF